MRERIGIGIVGAGLVSDFHAAGYIQHQHAELVAVCDSSREVAEYKGKSWNAKRVYTDFDEMLNDPEIQAVDIMTPPLLHHEMTIKAAETGRHVNCEKPFCTSVAEGKEMTTTAERNGVVLAVDETYLFTTAHTKARELIASGTIGEPLQIRHYKGEGVPNPENLERRRRFADIRKEPVMWRGDPVISGGGAYPWAFDHAVHLFATTQYLMMDLEVDSIFGLSATYTGKSGSDVDSVYDCRDIPILVWQFRDPGKQGYWVRAEKRANRAYNNRNGFSSIVLGTKGMLEVLGEAGGGLLVNGKPVHLVLHCESGRVETMLFEEGGDRVWSSGISYFGRAHINEVTHFIECIVNGKKPRYGGEEGTREVRLTLSAIKSAVDGVPVKVDQLDDDYRACRRS